MSQGAANLEILVQLAQVLVSVAPEDQQVRFMAALVLKNSVKNYVSEIVANGLTCQSLVEVLLTWLVTQEGISQSKKLV